MITGTNSSPFCTALVSSGSLTGSINGKAAKPEKWDLGAATSVLTDISMDMYNMKLAHTWATVPLTCCGIWAESLCLAEASISITKSFSPIPEPRHWLCSALVSSGLGLFAGAVAGNTGKISA